MGRLVNKAIIGEKVGMTQIFQGNLLIPVTVLRCGPCFVTQLKLKERDGYKAVQVGFGDAKQEKLTRPVMGHINNAKVKPVKYLAELPLDPAGYTLGQEIKVDVFSEGDCADVTGVSKGKGFAGVVKRWGFRGGPASHGSTFHRAPGSVGQCATPSRVFKGKKLPGRMGGEKVTVQNLQVVRVDSDRNLLLLKGAVPGPRGTIVLVRQSTKSGRRQ